MANFRKKIDHFVMKKLVVPRAPKITPGTKHIACVGDSITFGAGVGGKYKKTWEYFLNEKLGDQVQTLNYGISGRTMTRNGDFPYVDEKFYQLSLDLKADTYILMLGTNDAKPYNWNPENYEKDAIEFISSYQNLPNHPKVYVMLPPQCYVDPRIGKVGYDILAENIDGPILEILKRVTGSLQVETIDLHTFTQNHSEWFDDGVHPNEVGNKAIGEYIADCLLQIN